MSSRNKISEALQEQVRQRANFLCEFCHASEQWQYVKFTVDHTVPVSLAGETRFENLALACFHCNRKKANRVTAIAPESGKEVPLFNPRQHQWGNHFIWSNDCLLILGITEIGKATVALLDLNRERVIQIRAADKEIGRHPPSGDPVQES